MPADKLEASRALRKALSGFLSEASAAYDAAPEHRCGHDEGYECVPKDHHDDIVKSLLAEVERLRKVLEANFTYHERGEG